MSAVKKAPILSKVWNDNKFVHVEKYKGETVTIMPGSFVEMTPDDAEQFKGQFTPPRIFKGAPDPKFFKMIRIEHPENYGEEAMKYVCPVTGRKYDSAEELNASLARYSHLRHKAEDDPAASSSLRAEIDELKAQIRDLIAAQQPRGRGRPKKVETIDDGEATDDGYDA